MLLRTFPALVTLAASTMNVSAACIIEENDKQSSCTALTPQFIEQLKFKTHTQVIRAMKSPGRGVADPKRDALHFFSISDRGPTGDLTVTFENDQVTIINAMITMSGDELEYLWNSRLGGCSDFKGSSNKCK